MVTSLIAVLLTFILCFQIVKVDTIVHSYYMSESQKFCSLTYIFDDLGVKKPNKEIIDWIYRTANATGYDPVFLAVLIYTESSFNSEAISNKGYKSLTQTPEALDKGLLNILRGVQIFEEKMKYAKGDVYKAVALYKGGDNTEARKQAKVMMNLFREYKQRGM